MGAGSGTATGQRLSAKSRLRHYTNLDRMENKLDRLLSDYDWGRIDDVFSLVPAQQAADRREGRMNMQIPAVTVREAGNGDAARWDSFAASHPQSSIFHRFGWSRVISKAYGHETKYLIAEKAGTEQVLGLLPLIHVKSPFFGKS